jgi:hypothetical protein
MLLEHGPLTMREIITITGWPAKQTRRAVYSVCEYNQVIRVDGKWALWKLKSKTTPCHAALANT